MHERDELLEAQASGIAFVLLGDAFIRLANAYRLTDNAAGQALLRELERAAATALQRFAADRPADARGDVMAEAALQMRRVLRAAQGLEPDDE